MAGGTIDTNPEKMIKLMKRKHKLQLEIHEDRLITEFIQAEAIGTFLDSNRDSSKHHHHHRHHKYAHLLMRG